MRRYLAMLPLALLVACSPASPPPDQQPPKPKAAPDNAVLGSAGWYAWVDSRLHVTDDGHGPERTSCPQPAPLCAARDGGAVIALAGRGLVGKCRAGRGQRQPHEGQGQALHGPILPAGRNFQGSAGSNLI